MLFRSYKICNFQRVVGGQFVIVDLQFKIAFSFFFFKQKTAYEIAICDWSSDVCSSDLAPQPSNMDGGSTGFAIASMILGIVAILMMCCVPSFWLKTIVAVLGLVFGIISLQNKNNAGESVCGGTEVSASLSPRQAGVSGGGDRKSTRLNSSHRSQSRMPSSA